MKTTALDKVKAVKVYGRSIIPVSEDQIDVVLAWMKGEVQIIQMFKVGVFGKTSYHNAYARLAMVLREAYRRGRLKIVP